MIEVVNKYKIKKEEYLDNDIIHIYCGRGSVLGNPYPITKINDRDTVVSLYRIYFYKNIKNKNKDILDGLKYIKEMTNKYKTVKLVCFCAPQKCHCDIIKEYIDNNNI